MSQMAEAISKLSPEQLDRLQRILKGGNGGGAKASGHKKSFVAAEHGNFNLTFTKPGIIESLQFQVCERRSPRVGEVEIEVYAAGMNFRDVMTALGIYPLAPGAEPVMGGEVSGRIVAVGEGVPQFQVGDEVIAVAVGGFKAFVTVPAVGVLKKPASVTVETAAGIPVVFLTNLYALQHLARLSKGERVLIHSAAGGIGLSAVQIAHWIGAEVFATAGTPEKREFLESLGIAHVMDSRSLDFVGDVLKKTNGEGVDVILNSLTGDAIPKGLEILRPYGRFIELGKRDITEDAHIGLRPFGKGLSLIAVDLTWLQDMRPGLVDGMLRDLGILFVEETFKPLPTRFFPISQPATAFSFMSQGTHIGKIVFLVNGQEVLVEEPANLARPRG
jgi:NADPH:quinone reductase-like Zn-dependent oxidoreductase